jgi:hypothetical protein
MPEYPQDWYEQAQREGLTPTSTLTTIPNSPLIAGEQDWLYIRVLRYLRALFVQTTEPQPKDS